MPSLHSSPTTLACPSFLPRTASTCPLESLESKIKFFHNGCGTTSFSFLFDESYIPFLSTYILTRMEWNRINFSVLHPCQVGRSLSIDILLGALSISSPSSVNYLNTCTLQNLLVAIDLETSFRFCRLGSFLSVCQIHAEYIRAASGESGDFQNA